MQAALHPLEHELGELAVEQGADAAGRRARVDLDAGRGRLRLWWRAGRCGNGGGRQQRGEDPLPQRTGEGRHHGVRHRVGGARYFAFSIFVTVMDLSFRSPVSVTVSPANAFRSLKS